MNELLARLRRIGRLALPPDARVAVVTLGDDRLLDLDVAHEQPFPAAGELADEAADADMVRELERIRAERMQFLLVPDSARAWLRRHRGLARHLDEQCRLVLEEPDTGTVFALRDPLDTPPGGIGRDGLPVPPPELVHLVAGMFDWDRIYEPFLASGETGAACIRATLRANDLELEGFESVLDFGCGCGRVLRHWHGVSGPRLHGSDYNPYLIEWCRANLPFAAFELNGPGPPLRFEDRRFDFLYAISVFTHLVEAMQVPWAREVARVLRPGGFALVTLHGRGRLHELESIEDRERFEAGELVVLRSDRGGTNVAAVFHPQRYVREHLAPEAGLEVVDYRPDAQEDADQDVVLLRRP